jgi:hypothetical protein
MPLVFGMDNAIAKRCFCYFCMFEMRVSNKMLQTAMGITITALAITGPLCYSFTSTTYTR